MNMLPSILEATCEYRMQTTKFPNSYITEMAENSISELLYIFQTFLGEHAPRPPYRKTLKTRFKFSSLIYMNLTVIRYVTHSEVSFKTG